MSELPTGTVTLLLADIEGSTRLVGVRSRCDVGRGRPARQHADRPGGVAQRRAAGRAGRGRQFRGGVRPCHRCSGLCAEAAAGATRADQAAHRCAHRGSEAARRGKLHRPNDQQDRAPARSGPRRSDGSFSCHRGVGVRTASRQRVAHRSGLAPITRCCASGTSYAAVSSRSSQRVSAAPGTEIWCAATTSRAVHQFRRSRHRNGRGASSSWRSTGSSR